MARKNRQSAKQEGERKAKNKASSRRSPKEQTRAVRRVTTARRADIGELSNLLCDFLPLNAFGKNAVTFKTIFAESNIEHYLDGYSNKRQALEAGWIKVYRYHRQLPSMLIRKIVPAALAYRKHHRNPLTSQEIDKLILILDRLEIDMGAELRQVKIDESVPRIQTPPVKLEKLLREYNIEPAIAKDAVQLFYDGHLNEGVRKAGEVFEDRVHALTGLPGHGRDLMARAFADSTYINTSNIEPENSLSFVEGYKFLTMGVMAAVRNIFSHGDEAMRSPEECFEMLLFLNWLYRYLKLDEDTASE